MKYANPWHNPRNQHSPSFFETDAKPTEYKGYAIYHRINSTQSIESGAHVFDILRDGVLVAQYAGLNGAKRYIDGRSA